jgi:hypothetical protein
MDYKVWTGLSPPAAYHIVLRVEHTFKLTLSQDITSALGVRIFLVANKRNPPQPRELT